MNHQQETKTASVKAPRHRSPNYPGISLKRAIEKITAWYKEDGLVASPRDAALAHMGFDKFTGDAGRVLSALKSFGLVQEAEGRLKLTQVGVDIVAREDDDPKKLHALKNAALGPQIYRDLVKEYGVNLPSDSTLKSELIASKGFNPKAVDDFIRDFRTTLKNGGISESTVLESKTKEDDDEGNHVKVGDHVQWESHGVWQFPEPRRVTAISEDGNWAFVEGGSTGVPLEQLTAVDPPKNHPPNPDLKGKIPPPAPGVRQDVFSLAEGPVTIQCPAVLSPESFEDFSAWLDIIKRKIGRSVKQDYVICDLSKIQEGKD